MSISILLIQQTYYASFLQQYQLRFPKKILRSRKHDLKTTHITFQGFHVHFNTCPKTIFLKSAA